MDVGDIVLSDRGRDSGKLMVVLEVTPDGRLSLADGRVRHVEKPKLKQQKHVKPFSRASAKFCDKLSGGKVTNNELRRELISVMEEVRYG